MKLIYFLFLHISLFAAYFDCIVVGTSPFSLFEALYQFHCGKTVLILEQASECGGAWRAIEVCGIPHADLGCHQVGQDAVLKAFLEEYAGCKIVSMDDPFQPFEVGKGPNGWYFSGGCFEWIDHLLSLISATSISLYTNCKAESVSIDPSQEIATVTTSAGDFTTRKLILTQSSSIQFTSTPNAPSKWSYYHLYLLIQDPGPPRFSYEQGTLVGVSRAMNLTHFVGLLGTGQQLIVIQTHDERGLANGHMYLDQLKSQRLVDPSARLLKAEPYVYESGRFSEGTSPHALIEILQTGHISDLLNYIPRWKQALKPYSSLIPLKQPPPLRICG